MAYFVHDGIEFQTTRVASNNFGGPSTESVDALSLEAIISAIAPTAGTSALIPGASAAAQLTALEGYWEATGVSDTYERLSRDLLNNVAPLISGTLPAVAPDTGQAKYHRLSHQYILPVGLSNARGALPSSQSPANVAESVIRVFLKTLEVRHDHIRKHNDQDTAWEAWISYAIAGESDAEQTLARQGYLVGSD